MKNKKNNHKPKRRGIITVLGIAVVASLILIIIITIVGKPRVQTQTESVNVKTVSSQIQADGSITSQNEATLSFQTGGKLVYLPFKQGDAVTQGQTIASLDSYAIQEQLTAALNNYRSTRDAFDQTQEDAKTGVLQQNSSIPLDPFNPVGVSGVSVTAGGNNDYTIINDIAKRVQDQNQASLDNSVIQVQLANYALQLSTLTSPINGVITHEDVTVPDINITPATTFTVDDMDSLVFRANVNEEDINYIAEGSQAIVYLDGSNKPLNGTVVKIYPQKMTSPDGQSVYQVDVQTNTVLKSIAQFGQDGTVEIKSNAGTATRLVPAWTVLNDQYVWVDENGQKILKQVTVGKTHDDETEILNGLNDNDKVIVNPESIVGNKYSIL